MLRERKSVRYTCQFCLCVLSKVDCVNWGHFLTLDNLLQMTPTTFSAVIGYVDITLKVTATVM